MKIISWNINGIRAWYKKDGSFDWLLDQKPDFICFQETKATPEQIPEEILSTEGYYAHFDSPKIKKGYSGVGILAKVEPEKVEHGIGHPELDDEGRSISLFYDSFVLINTYFPNGGGGPIRLAYKLKFYEAYLKYLNKLKNAGYDIIFCGDVNTAHTAIDLARPKENEKNTGFLPQERAWIDKVVKSDYVDIWRHLNPKKENVYTYWDMKTRARDRNVGWRIDYFFITKNLVKEIEQVKIHDDIYGSNHCPISLKLKA